MGGEKFANALRQRLRRRAGNAQFPRDIGINFLSFIVGGWMYTRRLQSAKIEVQRPGSETAPRKHS
jgi:hypothetical protein